MTTQPFAADIVVPALPGALPAHVVAVRVMVHPATTTTIHHNGTPVMDMVNFVRADGVVEWAPVDWVRPRKGRKRGKRR